MQLVATNANYKVPNDMKTTYIQQFSSSHGIAFFLHFGLLLFPVFGINISDEGIIDENKILIQFLRYIISQNIDQTFQSLVWISCTKCSVQPTDIQIRTRPNKLLLLLPVT